MIKKIKLILVLSFWLCANLFELNFVLAYDLNQERKKVDLLNFHIVHPYLFRGGEPSDKGLEILKVKGVTTIIDLRHNDKAVKAEQIAVNNLGMQFINLPMSDKAPTKEQVKTFIATVEKAKTNQQIVYVHCAHGSDRTGCMVGIWRVTHDGFTYPKTYQEMRKYYFSPKYTKLSHTVLKYSKN